MNARQLFEAPIDFGGAPDFIHPDRKRKIERGAHPYARNKSFPSQPGPGSFPAGETAHPKPEGGQVSSYADLVASDSYVSTVKKLARYTGTPVGRIHPGALMRQVGAAFGAAKRAQAAHKEEMEAAAVETVLQLEEFKSLKPALRSGRVKIDAKLVDEVSPEGLNPQEMDQTEQEEAEQQIAEIAQELDAEKQKRRMINVMIQGASADNSFAFHLMSDLLNQIDPALVNQYGLLMAFGDLQFWSVPEEVQKAAHRGEGGGGPMGKSWIEFHDDKSVTIHAVAGILPLLVHEIVKGLMEYLSHNSDDPDDLRRQVQGQVDTVDNESWDIPFGAGVWRQIRRVIGAENMRYMPWVQRHLSKLPPGQFHDLMQGILKGDPQAKAKIKQVVDKAKERNPIGDSLGRSKSPSRSLVERLIG